ASQHTTHIGHLESRAHTALPLHPLCLLPPLLFPSILLHTFPFPSSPARISLSPSSQPSGPAACDSRQRLSSPRPPPATPSTPSLPPPSPLPPRPLLHLPFSLLPPHSLCGPPNPQAPSSLPAPGEPDRRKAR
ncbi:unnamed protein product, partial [Closterium sp. NIES-54]